MIEIRGLRKSFGSDEVLKGIDLSIEEKEVVVIIGPSGSGKSTLLRCMNHLEEPTEGEVVVDGITLSSEANINKVREEVGMVFQRFNLFPHMTVEENISYVPRLWNKGDHARTQRAVQKWMALMRLPETLLSRYPDELSGGQQQRVGIARALAASPEILLMDEPFGAVDEVTRSALQEELRRIHRETGITILFVTHDVREAMRLGTHVIVVAEGRVHQYGAPEAVRENPATAFVAQLIQVLRE